MKKTYITPCVKIHQLKAKRRLLAGSGDPEQMSIRSRETSRQW